MEAERRSALAWFKGDDRRFSEWERQNTGWIAVRANCEERWNEFCREVERRVRGEDAEDAAAQRFRTSVFGRCRRCGSERISVTTRQLRRLWGCV